MKNKLLLVSVCLSAFWMFFCTIAGCNTLTDGMNSGGAGAVGTAIGALLVLPFMVVAWVGVIFNCIGWATEKRGFVLTAAILFSVSLVLMITYGFGLIPSLVLSYVSYARMKNIE